MADDKPDEQNQEESENENVDKMDAGFLGNYLKFSGPSMSKLLPFVGWALIIGISALSIAHILRTVLVNWK